MKMPRTRSESTKPTQCSLILDYIKEHGSITNGEAFLELGVGRLSARIGELRECGFPIKTVTVKGRNRRNQPIAYAKYVIEN